MDEFLATITEIDHRIATVRENLRDLVELASGSSGAGDDELISQRIAEQQELLEALSRRRDELRKEG